MRLYGDYHTHTIFSHGKGTIEDNVNRAIEIGLKEIAISDHGPGHLGFGLKRKKLKVMRAEIDRLNAIHPKTKILLAVEANILGLDGTIDVREEDMQYYDMVLCGYHFGSSPKSFFRDTKIHMVNILNRKFGILGEKAMMLNTEMVINAIKKNRIDYFTHPGAKGPIDIIEVAKAAEEAGTALEINNSHGYLNLEQLLVLKDMEVKFYIGSDAHRPEDIGIIDDALLRVREAGISEDRIINLSR